MSKKGSALMQVLVIGLIVASFAILILRYAVTRSSNLTRTARILEADIIADSCLEQYMSYMAASELSGEPPCSNYALMDCLYYPAGSNTVSSITMTGSIKQDVDNSSMVVTTFTVPIGIQQANNTNQTAG